MRAPRRTCLATVVAMVLALGLGAPAAVTAQELNLLDLPLPAAPINRESREINVVVDNGLKRTVELPTRALRNARIALLDKQTVAPDLLRRLAERRETLAAARYVDYLVGLKQESNFSSLDVTQQGIDSAQLDSARGETAIPGYTGRNYHSDIAYFSAIAVGGGRGWVLDDMIRAMRQLNPETEPRQRINTYIRMLYPQAWAGNELALEAVIEFNGEGKLFGKLSDKTRAKIQEALSATGTGRGEMKLALGILSRPNRTPEDVNEALPLLEVAARSEILTISTMAKNLIAYLTGPYGARAGGLTTY